jgi:replicative DNA helicase
VTSLSLGDDWERGIARVERLDDLARVEHLGEERDLSLPPHSTHAEEAVLGSVLKQPSSILRVADRLKGRSGGRLAEVGDFYDVRAGLVFHAMLQLYGEGVPIDYHTVADRLTQLGTYDQAGGLLYLSDLSLATPTAAFIEHYADIVERTSYMRRIISACQSIAEMAFRDEEPSLDKALGAARDKILAITDFSRGAQGFRSLEDILSDYMEQLASVQEGEAARYGIPTGYIDLDKILGGLQRGDLVIVAARTSVGKTQLVLNIAVNAALKANATVAMFSLEMSVDQIAGRFLSLESGVESERIRTAHLNEQEAHKLDAAMNVLARAPILIDDSPRLTIGEIQARTRRLATERNIDLLLVDYIGLIPTDERRNRSSELGVVTGLLKELARTLNIPVIALCQLNREVEKRGSHIPQLSDLRESGNIEQDADVVVFLNRDEMHDPDTDKKGVADVIVAKHRNGPRGQAQLLFLERTGKFLDLEVYRA